MVIKGRSRGGGAQLAEYLENSRGNDRAIILEVRGTTKPDDLSRSLSEMSMSSRLSSKGEKGLYHAQINPAIGEDSRMTENDWLAAADILEKKLGLSGQSRAIVLHEKKGRVHSHIVWERYDSSAGKLISDSKNFKVHDQARAEIELMLRHERTPQKSNRKKTVDHKKILTALWEQNASCSDFIKAANKQGYQIAMRDDRRPYRAVASDGENLDLVRQLKAVKSKDVKTRFETDALILPSESEVLKRLRTNLEHQINHDKKNEKNPFKLRKIADMELIKELNNLSVELNPAAKEGIENKEAHRVKVLRDLLEKRRLAQEQERNL